MSIGLKRGIVRLEKHQPIWNSLFQQEKALLQTALGTHVVDIQHIGSTAIEGIDAKPILDILLGLPDLADEPQVRPLLEGSGYLHRGENGVAGRILYVKGDETYRTHHLHMTAYESAFWVEQIRFRDALNANPEIAQAYNHLKHELAAQYPEDRVSYTDGKKTFIEHVLQTYKR